MDVNRPTSVHWIKLAVSATVTIFLNI